MFKKYIDGCVWRWKMRLFFNQWCPFLSFLSSYHIARTHFVVVYVISYAPKLGLKVHLLRVLVAKLVWPKEPTRASWLIILNSFDFVFEFVEIFMCKPILQSTVEEYAQFCFVYLVSIHSFYTHILRMCTVHPICSVSMHRANLFWSVCNSAYLA
jgi:hypothetical protein